MKTEELTAIGLSEEQITKVFELNGKDVNAAKEAGKASRDEEVKNLTDQLTTTKDALKAFDGVDPEALNSEIQSLNQKLQEKDQEWAAKLAERDFNDTLSEAITKSGGKNAKAIAALMDLKTLRESKNQREDIDKAIEEVKKDNDYLFTSNEPINNPVAKTGGKKPEDSAAKREAARKAMGLPPEEDKK